MIEKDGVHHLPDEIVASKGEGEVANTTAHLGMRQMPLDPANCLNKVYPVIFVLINPGSNSKHIGIEDNISGIKSVISQQPVCSFTDRDPTLVRICLSRLVESHHHHGSAIGLCQASLL